MSNRKNFSDWSSFHFSCMLMRFRVKSPSRLHMSLIDLNGELGRVDGGFGIALDQPNMNLEFSDEGAPGLITELPDEYTQSVIQIRDALVAKYDIQFSAISVKSIEMIPPHIGLGSKTQFLLSVARGLAHLAGIKPSAYELAIIVHRGGTSGIGYNAFEYGGFIVDLGHSYGKAGEKASFLPSSASHAPPALPLIHEPCPKEWLILLIRLNVRQGANNDNEVTVFQTKCPIPRKDVEKIAHRLIMQVIPAVKLGKLGILADAMQFISKHGFKAVEIALQHPLIAQLIQDIYAKFRFPVGMSSFGPIIYVITDSVGKSQSVQNFVEQQLKEQKSSLKCQFIYTRPAERGVTIEPVKP